MCKGILRKSLRVYAALLTFQAIYVVFFWSEVRTSFVLHILYLLQPTPLPFPTDTRNFISKEKRYACKRENENEDNAKKCSKTTEIIAKKP